ncbi:MAG TPA: YetF domain-containing protein [Phycisphaerae bacterium]|nr:YetF domain-containing protein [Phycisphaerae bacterium]
MDSVLNALAMYLFLVVLMRLSGRRTLGEMTTFDFVLMLVVGEATQQALLNDDRSMTNSWIVIATLIGLDVAMSLLKSRYTRAAAILEGLPTVLIRDGRILRDRMKRCRVDEAEILQAARAFRGLERLDQIKHAVLEPDGGVSIIAKSSAPGDS